MSNRNARNKAILTSLLVTFFWSTSWVFIKLGLQEIPPLFFAGLRYSLAVLCLLPFFVFGKEYRNLRSLTQNDWKNMVRLGVIGYAIAQGALFIGLKLLPTMGVSLLLNLSPVVVTFIGISALAEKPTKFQWVGLILNIFGLFIYYGYSSILSGQGIGVLIVMIGMAANSISTIIGREMNKQASFLP